MVTKNRNRGKVSLNWIAILCLISFCLGVLFSNRCVCVCVCLWLCFWCFFMHQVTLFPAKQNEMQNVWWAFCLFSWFVEKIDHGISGLISLMLKFNLIVEILTSRLNKYLCGWIFGSRMWAAPESEDQILYRRRNLGHFAASSDDCDNNKVPVGRAYWSVSLMIHSYIYIHI